MIKIIKHKAYRFRLYPDKAQQVIFAKTFGCVRFIYNKMLEDKIDYYQARKMMLNTTPAQYKSEFEWLNEVDSLALANAQLNLQRAFKNFFQHQTEFPKFKSKHRGDKSYTTNNQNGSIRIEDGKYIKLPKIGLVRIKVHRQIPQSYKIKSCTISQSPSGKYYVSILTEYETDIQPVKVIEEDKIIGLDMDMKNLFTDSQGKRAGYPRYYRKMQDKLSKEQRKLSKCVNGSNNYYKQKRAVAKLHEKVANQRRDFLHKLSDRIVNDYDAVCIEDLNMKAMGQCLNLEKSVADNGWGMFTSFLNYKLEDKGKVLVRVDKWYPSSKTCSVCGYEKEGLTLDIREWECPNCHTIHDRDINAAINIKRQGLRVMSHEFENRGTHGDSSLILSTGVLLSEKPLLL
ncbi:MAG: transposase [Thermotogae bacterium]|nr:transposase [Thermotogota bacterium]